MLSFHRRLIVLVVVGACCLLFQICYVSTDLPLTAFGYVRVREGREGINKQVISLRRSVTTVKHSATLNELGGNGTASSSRVHATSTPNKGERVAGTADKDASKMHTHCAETLPRLGDPASCVGKELGEVEDVLCWPRPNYEASIKNPCWWEKPEVTVDHADAQNGTVNHSGTQSTRKFRLGLPAGNLYCLPYFHILGTSKAGTTDLYRRISLHPHIVPNSRTYGKETLYWSWGKYGYRYRGIQSETQPLAQYIASFTPLTRRLMAPRPHNRAHLVTLDASPPDMWDFRGWPLLPQNRGLREPVVLSPHLMKHVYRNPKFIVLLRDPVERMYTAYFFHQMGINPQTFHYDVKEGIAQFNRCLASAPNRKECYFNSSVIDPITVELSFACPAVHIREWFAVFPRKHFLFMRTESYAQNLGRHLLKVFKFLDLPLPTESLLQKMVYMPVSYHTRKKDKAGPMLPETRALLQDYVQACNRDLADLLGDDAFSWKDVYQYSQFSDATNRADHSAGS